MASLFKEFSIELDLHKSAKAARKAKKHLLKHAIKLWFNEAEDLMNKRKGFFPWSKPLTKKEALKATLYYEKGLNGNFRHRVVTCWQNEITGLNDIITLAKVIKETKTIKLKGRFASFLILFFEKE